VPVVFYGDVGMPMGQHRRSEFGRLMEAIGEDGVDFDPDETGGGICTHQT
jgi:hypothetical protein